MNDRKIRVRVPTRQGIFGLNMVEGAKWFARRLPDVSSKFTPHQTKEEAWTIVDDWVPVEVIEITEEMKAGRREPEVALGNTYVFPTRKGVISMDFPNTVRWIAWRLDDLPDDIYLGKTSLHKTEVEARAIIDNWVPVEVIEITEDMKDK